MPLSSGTRLGPYEILAHLSSGGMGDVYRAADERLQREVAIKVSSAQFSERFTREARMIASLSHPNICTLFDVGPDYLVMELIEGPTLADRIKEGVIPLPEALHIALQIASALEAAHERGIVHRDLKPSNIKVKRDGTVKVLDFGIAKVSQTRNAPAEDAPTFTMSATEAGAILGTAAYMAPEQAQGKVVDKRADIWAFGVVLYEMLTGKRLFQGETLSDTLASVLTREPDWKAVPPHPLRVLRRCLERDPKRRLRDIGEVRFLLEEAPASVQVAAGRSRLYSWIVTGVLAASLAGALWMLWAGARPTDRPMVRLDVDLGPQAPPGANLRAAISPDGTRLVFAARSADGKQQLATRLLSEPKVTLLAGTDNGANPFFSPDGQWIGFFAGGQMKKISVQGGASVRICEAVGVVGGSWGDDQSIVFASATASSLMRVSSTGGTPQPLTRTGERGDATHRWPQVLPGGRSALFTSHKLITGFDDATIEAVVLNTGERKTVLRGGYFGRYLPGRDRTGYLIYAHDGALFGVAFDPLSLEVHGTASPLLDDLASNSDSGEGQFDVSSTGTLIYRSGKGPSRTWPILWLDNSGKTQPLVAEPGAYYTLNFSPDRTRLALMVDKGDNGRQVAVYDWQRGSMSRITFTGQLSIFPVWSPDGKYLVFETASSVGYGIGLVRSDGSGGTQRILEHVGIIIPGSFSPDGRRLAWHELNPATSFDILTAAFDTSDPDHPKTGKPVPFLNTPYTESNPQFSPDGRWLSYTSNESGRGEVYVRPFEGPGGKWQVSTTGGGQGTWAPNGRELYFRGSDLRIMVADYTVKGDSFIAAKPRVWADVRTGVTPFGRDLALGPDGKGFAVFPAREPVGESGSAHVSFVLNLLDEVRRRIPER